jgi:hypothetical protein
MRVHSWPIRRQGTPCPNAIHRWDQVYALLVQIDASVGRTNETGLPFVTDQKEHDHATGDLCSSLDHAPSSGTDH